MSIKNVFYCVKGGEEVVARIKALCKEKKITITKLEQELGFARGYIYKLNSLNPSIENVKKIASYLNVTIDELANISDK